MIDPLGEYKSLNKEFFSLWKTTTWLLIFASDVWLVYKNQLFIKEPLENDQINLNITHFGETTNTSTQLNLINLYHTNS